MIGLTWMAQEILVLAIFFLLSVLNAFWGPEICRVVWKFLEKAPLNFSSERKRDLLKARPLKEHSPKNDDPNDVIEPRIKNRPADFENN